MFLENLSLKIKTSLAVTALFTLFSAAVAWLSLLQLERDFRASIYDGQFALVESLAGGIDDKLELAMRALAAAAPSIPEEAFSDPSKAQKFLDGKTGLLSIFDNGIYILSGEGKVVAESPPVAGGRGRSITHRAYYKKTLELRKPVISDPYLSFHNLNHPAVMLTVPVFHGDGSLRAIIAGSFDLLGNNLLEDIIPYRIGKTGYVYLIAKDRRLIMHPERKRIMEITPKGVNHLLDEAIEGFEGTGETVTSRGIPMVSSFKRLRTTGWILSANYPQSEAYAGLRKVLRNFLLIVVAGAIAAVGGTWLVLKRLTHPLELMTRHVKALPGKQGSERFLPVACRDEIGTLAAEFNAMVEKLDRQQEALRENEVSLQLRAAELERANRELEAFSYTVAHDLRSPLTTIHGYCQILSDTLGRGGDEEVGRTLATVCDASCRMEQIIETLLDFSRLSSRALVKREVNLTGLAEEVMAEIRGTDPRRDLYFSLQQGMVATGDEVLLRLALKNLLDNAWKYTGKTGVAEIGFGFFEGSGERVYFVRDNGVGFDPSLSEQVFETFGRLHTESDFPGSGIGLATVRRIVTRHGGRVWAQGKAGHGSTFFFTLPDGGS